MKKDYQTHNFLIVMCIKSSPLLGRIIYFFNCILIVSAGSVCIGLSAKYIKSIHFFWIFLGVCCTPFFR